MQRTSALRRGVVAGSLLEFKPTRLAHTYLAVVAAAAGQPAESAGCKNAFCTFWMQMQQSWHNTMLNTVLLLLLLLLQAKKLGSGKYAFKSLLVELPNKALKGAEGTAAATAAAQHATAAQELRSTASTSSSSSSSSSSTSDMAGSTGAAAAAAGRAAVSAPARVYIVGGPKGSSSALQEAASADPSSSSSSSSSVNAAMSSQEPAAQALLEQLKQPLVFALQQNLVIYEAEDEMEGELGYNTVLELDPAQLTVWDRAVQGGGVVLRGGVHWSKVAGCEVVKLARRSMQALRQPRSSSSSSSKAPEQDAASVGAGAASANSSSSSSTGGAAAAPEKA
jgi:hypothetical protein